ncbi:hypothetical protein [Arsenophonus sp. ENCA]|uniref:hypothetical protein n=1 Tax=Arsenophonus sp. ENCA TaxID=1987579 RepID=UPI0025C0DC77|nr:hypothetical protein [Arsenophonus sp. ENCA]
MPSTEYLKQRKRRYRLSGGFKSKKEWVPVTPTARRSLWLRRTAGAKRRGTNSQSEEAEEHPMPIEARSHRCLRWALRVLSGRGKICIYRVFGKSSYPQTQGGKTRLKD